MEEDAQILCVNIGISMNESFDINGNWEGEMPERRRAAVEEGIRRRLDVGISVERDAELSREIEMIAEIFEVESIPFFIAGGTGLDLLDGKWSREHLDLDIAVSEADKERVYDAMTAGGFSVTDSRGNVIHTGVLTDLGVHNNIFCKQKIGDDVYNVEIMFLEESENGDVKINDAVAAPREAYTNAPVVKIGEHSIPLQPTEVILFHKLTDGRRKDFRDLEKAWESLSLEARERINGYVRESHLAFFVGGAPIALLELFSAAHEYDLALQKEFFTKRIGEIEKKLNREIVDRAKEIFAMYDGEKGAQVFQKKLEDRYGDLTPEREKAFQDISEYLCTSTAPIVDQFVHWATEHMSIERQVEQTAFREYVSKQLWECKRAAY